MFEILLTNRLFFSIIKYIRNLRKRVILMKLNEFQSNPNQRLIKIYKSNYGKSNFCILGTDEVRRAMNNLSGTAFKLYVYLMANNDDFEFWLSYSHVHKTTGLSKSSYQRAFRELTEKGYLVPHYERKNLYTAYDVCII